MSAIRRIGLWGLLGLLFTAGSLSAQEIDCDPSANLPVASGEVLFNYGSATNAFSFTNRSDFSIGQPLVGRGVNQNNFGEFGFWTRFLLPPQAPVVMASEGNFPDRVQIRWQLDPLSAKAPGGFIIERDGAYLDRVDAGTNQYIDFNVQAGELYEYCVKGSNQFGTGSCGVDVGFVNPNGLVTGQINTFSGNAVANAIVTMSPTTGRSLAFDGTEDYLCLTYDEALPTDMFTVSAWVKIGNGNDRGGIIDLGSDLHKNFWLHTTANGSPKGVIAGVGDGTNDHELEVAFTESPDDWHHVAMVYGGGTILVYVDGSFSGSAKGEIDNVPALFHMGSNHAQTSYFGGRLDDVRIYNRPLTQTEILLSKDVTVSSNAENLVGYWKFDEGMGQTAFDLSPNEIDAAMEGATFSEDAADVLNAGVTDNSGYYIIEGVNYSEEQTFEVTPRKDFYKHSSLEFNAAYDSYVELGTFDIADTSTIDISIRPFDLVSRQSILSQGGNFNLYLENSNYYLNVNGSDALLGPATNDFVYLSLTMDSGAGEVKFYRNGNLETTLTGVSVSASYDSSPWRLGALDTGSDYYTGLIDEVAFFNGFVDLPTLQLHASPLAGNNVTSGIDPANPNILAHYPLDDGIGTTSSDYSTSMFADAQIDGAAWSIIAYRQEVSAHEFAPSKKIVNLNTSATAVSGVNFIDQSTVTISGAVFFSNTNCAQDSVELLVNGLPASPPIFTDSTGRFVGDFEPGANVRLTPRFDDTTHLFTPGFFETRDLNRPIAGVGFSNTTKREISGQIAGGVCRMSINFPDAPLVIKAASLNGCYEQEIELTALDGKYLFQQLPPIPLTVSIIYHPDIDIYDFFQLQGGATADMRRMEKDTIDFIYTAPPNVELEAFDEFVPCGNGAAFLQQSTARNGFRLYDRDVRVYEMYKDARCYLEAFDLQILNSVADASPHTVSVEDTSTYNIQFYAGEPNLGGDYTKALQVVATTQTGTASGIQRVVVLGERARESTFTTASPNVMPFFILRDPPGDESSSTLASGSQICKRWGGASLFSAETMYAENIDISSTTTVYAGTPVAGTIEEFGVNAQTDITVNTTASTNIEGGTEVCVTTDREYSTSDGDDVVGRDADLYVGAAVNFEFAATDILKYDFENCEFQLEESFKVFPDGIATTYQYSEWQLLTDVIPSLEAIGDTSSADSWRSLIKLNELTKAAATLRENITFDALNTFTETVEVTTEDSYDWAFDLEVTSGMVQTLGTVGLPAVNTTITMGMEITAGVSLNMGSTETESRAVSFTLADDDPNDNWSIDILEDGVFETPVFKVRAGETMCPWEPGTLNREQVIFDSDQLSDVNVPANGQALYNLRLTNDSQTGNDPLIYVLGMVEGSNPDGAIVSVDGEGLTEPRAFQILPGETLEILLTIERGPEAYSYSDIGVFMASECMLEHSRGLGYDLSDSSVNFDRFGNVIRQGIYDPSDLTKFYKELRLNAEFLEPCTPIDISFPMQDFVVTPDDNNRTSITLVEYNNEDPDLNVARVQYRPTGGDGSWINIVELPAAEFANDPVFKLVPWEMAELADGPYDIRAVTECFDLNLNPGISRVVQGRKETRPPVVFGTPEPADGVLSPGDEISITYSKRIQCDQIFQALGIGTNIDYKNLALLDATTGLLIDATISCSGDKIIIVPNTPNQFIENRTLRVVAQDMLDLYGNPTDSIAWEFFVNRSDLYWAGGGIDEMVVEGNAAVISREIRNQGGVIASFNIPDVPSWMSVFPRSGSLAPGERVTVNFEFDSDLVPNIYDTELIMETVQGDEPLDVEFRVTCEGPDWNFNPAAFSFSMNMTVELDIEGELSEDRVDRIGAFVNGELRGLAYIEKNDELVTDNAGVNPYLAFLTIYGNVPAGETVTFQIWDASDCELYGSTAETFPFVADGLIGEPLDPQTIHTESEVLRKIYINPGWNWISYNIDLPDASTDAALETLTNAGNTSIIKGQTSFSQFTPSLDRWLGSLTELSNLTMYQLRSSAYDSLTLIGQTTDASQPIPISQGWNWIGYLPARGMAVNDALAYLSPLNGDVIKGQFAFAQYVAGVGWIGNLNFMSSPNGYLMRFSGADTELVYPASNNLTDPTVGVAKSLTTMGMKSAGSTPWEVFPENYEFSMNIIGMVQDSLDAQVLAEGDAIGAFVDGEVRGTSEVMYVEALDKYLVFLTVYASQEGELVSFRFYDASRDEEVDLKEFHPFLINQVMGNVEQPEEFHLNSILSSANNTELVRTGFRAFPNPATDKVFLDFTARVGERVAISVHNIYGQQVTQINVEVPASSNLIEWTPDNLPAGVYTITLRRANTVETIKLELR